MGTPPKNLPPPKNLLTKFSFLLSLLPLAGIIALPTTLLGLFLQLPEKPKKIQLLTLGICITWACLWVILYTTSPLLPTPKTGSTTKQPHTQTALTPKKSSYSQTQALQILQEAAFHPNPSEETLNQTKTLIPTIIQSPEDYNPPCLLITSLILWHIGEIKNSSSLIEKSALLAEIGWLRAAADCALYQDSPDTLPKTLLPQIQKALQPLHQELNPITKETLCFQAVLWDQAKPKNYPRNWPDQHDINLFLTPTKLKPKSEWNKSDQEIRNKWGNKTLIKC